MDVLDKSILLKKNQVRQINSDKHQHVNHKRKHVGNKSKKQVKKKSNTLTNNTLLQCQTRLELPIEKVLQFLDNLPLPACYKTKHLLDFANNPDWMQDFELVLLNTINITPTPFAGSYNVLPCIRNDDDPTLDGPRVDVATD